MSSNKNNPERNDEDSPYENLVRSLTNRGKNKRKVKLVEDKLIQLTFGDHSDSEDDEDFTLGADDIDSDDSNYDGDADRGKDYDDDNDESAGESGPESESSQDDQNSTKLENFMTTLKAQNDADEESLLATDDNASVKSQDDNNVGPVKKIFLVCGICLESESSETDEILECDNCGITVHEGCYGDIDAPDGDNESESDAPTEPWFCEPCKAGLAESPICELCPNIGGIYKLTDTKKWVHLICALYTPFVGFRDVSKLQTVVLEDIRSSMWGGRECMFCLDDNFSRTGVCVSCDAGLCKSAFHVTCGQRNGFLSDIPDKTDSGDNGADLLYAHCKLHSVKYEIDQRKRSWLTFQSHVGKFQQSDDQEDKKRITDCLQRAKHDFVDYQNSIIQPKQPVKELARLLSSCPEACKLLAKKAEILGMLKHPGYNVAAAVTQGRIIKHEPNLSSEFINYFFKREMESKEIILTLKTAEPALAKLRKEQKVLTKKSEEYHEKLCKVQRDKENVLKSCSQIHDSLHKLSNKTFKLPNILKPKHVKENKGKLEETSKLLNTVVNRCATCKLNADQHLLAQCDTCKHHYHLACLDPPLTRMPKKSDKYLWQCTECDSSDESESDVERSDTDGVRRNKRRSTKEPVKFTPEDPTKNLTAAAKDLKRSADASNSTPKPKKKKTETKKKASKKVDPEKRKARKPKPKKEMPPPESLGDCCICNKSGDKTNLVKCDECLKCYHFKACLDPPYSKTPKGKFYGWICEDCDESGDDEEDSANDGDGDDDDNDADDKNEGTK